MVAYNRNKDAVSELLGKKMQLIFGRNWKQKISQFLDEHQTSPLAFETNFKKEINRKLEGALRIFSAVSTLYSGNFPFIPSELEDQMEAMRSIFQMFLQ